jgi:hypothetical protein
MLTDVSEELTVSVFREEEEAKQTSINKRQDSVPKEKRQLGIFLQYQNGDLTMNMIK